jgi:hypothetical protein
MASSANSEKRKKNSLHQEPARTTRNAVILFTIAVTAPAVFSPLYDSMVFEELGKRKAFEKRMWGYFAHKEIGRTPLTAGAEIVL